MNFRSIVCVTLIKKTRTFYQSCCTRSVHHDLTSHGALPKLFHSSDDLQVLKINQFFMHFTIVEAFIVDKIVKNILMEEISLQNKLTLVFMFFFLNTKCDNTLKIAIHHFQIKIT